jgi:hypothetical protein
MGDVLDAFCASCGGKTPAATTDSVVPCRYCGAIIRVGKAEVRVEGHSADDVEKVARAVLAEDRESEQVRARLRSPWVAGSFYLVALLSVLSLLLVAGALLPLWVVPVVVIGGILGVAVVGALQLRQDEGLSERNFLELMRLTLARLPLLTRREPPG